MDEEKEIHPMPAVSENCLVVQANPLIEARYKLGLLPQQLLRVLISQIKPEHTLFEDGFYQIDIAKFGELINYSGGSLYPNLLRAGRTLMKTLMVFNYTNSDGKDEILETPWVIAVKHHPRSGVMRFASSPCLSPFLLHLKKEFTQYQLVNICQLRSQHSIRIYEFLKQYVGLGKRTIPIEKLREIVGAEKRYKEYVHFRQRVLSAAHDDIINKTDLSYHWRPIKTGKKVTSIEFYDIIMKDAPMEDTPATSSLQ